MSEPQDRMCFWSATPIGAGRVQRRIDGAAPKRARPHGGHTFDQIYRVLAAHDMPIHYLVASTTTDIPVVVWDTSSPDWLVWEACRYDPARCTSYDSTTTLAPREGRSAVSQQVIRADWSDHGGGRSFYADIPEPARWFTDYDVAVTWAIHKSALRS